uniref:Hexosyltransferase n=1 Tax=Lactuca sativa TaxID=4236 RepID=A0A9R1WS27_LACSA|nr:hypothetical protein LSAT_V11C900482940 [Lactuca sativa]
MNEPSSKLPLHCMTVNFMLKMMTTYISDQRKLNIHMKKGTVFTDPKLKWYEPLGFRMFSNEDVTIDAWMLAMNVNHEDNRQLCQIECTLTSIVVWDLPKCSGLCNPEKKMLELHQKESCAISPTLPAAEED